MFLPARASLFAGLLSSLTACATVVAGNPTGDRMISDGQTFGLHPGEHVSLADQSTLAYVRLVNDSRCPPGVQCIWAGDAEVAFEWTPAHGAAHAFSLHTGMEPKQQVVGERRLTLVSLERGDAPEAQLRVDRGP